MALVDIACTGQFRSAWANINIAILVEDEVGTAECAIGAFRFVPNRHVRCDVAIYQPFEQPDRAIDRVACEPLRPQIEAALNAVHHRLGNGNLHCSVCSSAHGIDDDADLVVDQVVCIVGKEGVQAWPRNPRATQPPATLCPARSYGSSEPQRPLARCQHLCGIGRDHDMLSPRKPLPAG